MDTPTAAHGTTAQKGTGMTSPPIQSPVVEPWLDESHWSSGDAAVIANASHEQPIVIVSPHGPTGRFVKGTRVDAAAYELSAYSPQLRHTDVRCSACAESLRGLRERRDAEYVGQWSAQARARSSELRAQIDWPPRTGCLSYGGTFTGRADVPPWLREVTAGMLVTPDRGELCVARIQQETIDWATLLAAHPGDLELVVNEGNPELNLTWELLVSVFEAINDAGLAAYFDVDLVVTNDGRLGVWPMMVGSHDLEVFDLTPDSDGNTYYRYAGDHPELVEQITAVLGVRFEAGFWQIL